jgi:photosystem II stability/assembly factor-like uncharacterized protein
MKSRAPRKSRLRRLLSQPRLVLPLGALAVLLAAIAAGAGISVWSSTEAAPADKPAPADMAPDAPYIWRPVAIGGGGFITDCVFDPTGTTRIARTDTYGAYIWSADQDRWLQLVNTASIPVDSQAPNILGKGVYAIAVAPSDPRRIYMAIAGMVFRSTDAGRHFTRGKTEPASLFFDANGEFRMYGSFLAVNPANPDIALLGTPHGGLLRTSDGGLTWQNISNLPRGREIRPKGSTRSPGVLVWFTGKDDAFAFSYGNGMFRSHDGGASFAPLSKEGRQPRTLKQGVFASDGDFYAVDNESHAVWKFADGRWTDLSGAMGLRPRRFATIAVSKDARKLFVFDEGGDAYASTDAGASWRRLAHAVRVGKGDPPWLHVADKAYFPTARVAFDPVMPDRLWVGAGEGMFYADVPDGAATITWFSQTRGIEQLTTTDIIQPPGQAPLFSAWDFGIHRKDDLNAFSTTYGPKERVLIAAQDMDWSASDPAFIVTNASDTRKCCSDDGDSVLAGYSNDGGRTWTKFASLPTPPGTQPSDPWRMAYGAIAVSANDTRNIVWVPALNRAPYYTKDRGATWQRIQFPGEVLPLTGSFGNYPFDRRNIAADRVLPGRFYFYHSGDGANGKLAGLWRTDNGGESWSKVFNGPIGPSSFFSAKLRPVPGKAGHLFFAAGVPDNPGAKLMRSIDGGATWTAFPDIDRVVDIGFGKPAKGADYPAMFIVGTVSGQYGVWRSIDNAATWKRVGQFPYGSLDEVIGVEGDKDHFGRVYVAFIGSSFGYGEPADCKPAPYAFGARNECYAAP